MVQINHSDTDRNGLSDWYETVPPPAIVKISPKTLNNNSYDTWITGFIEVQGYSPELIDISTVTLNDTIHAEINPTGIGDNNGNGTPDMMVKFNRSEVQNLILPGNVTIIIAGKVNDAAFLGEAQIMVIDIPAKEKGSGNKGGEEEKNEI